MYGRTSSRRGRYGLLGLAASFFEKVANSFADPSRPGLMKSKIDQRSPSRLSIGVPVRANRTAAFSFFTACVCFAAGS